MGETDGGRAGLRRALVVLVVLLVVALVVLVTNLVPIAPSTSVEETPQAVRQEATSTISLAAAHDRASERASAWDADAVLVRVEASWYATPTWRDLAVPPLAWGFLYYAPESGELATVVVDDDALLWVPPRPIPIRPPPLDTFPPSYGPALVWLTFLAGGGEEFLASHSDAELVFRLQASHSKLLWTVTAAQEMDQFEVALDAETGIVIDAH